MPHFQCITRGSVIHQDEWDTRGGPFLLPFSRSLVFTSSLESPRLFRPGATLATFALPPFPSLEILTKSSIIPAWALLSLKPTGQFQEEEGYKPVPIMKWCELFPHPSHTCGRKRKARKEMALEDHSLHGKE